MSATPNKRPIAADVAHGVTFDIRARLIREASQDNYVKSSPKSPKFQSFSRRLSSTCGTSPTLNDHVRVFRVKSVKFCHQIFGIGYDRLEWNEGEREREPARNVDDSSSA